MNFVYKYCFVLLEIRVVGSNVGNDGILENINKVSYFLVFGRFFVCVCF